MERTLNRLPTVCICGGGHIGHALVALWGALGAVSCLTRRPEQWGQKLSYQVGSKPWRETGEIFVSSDPAIVSQHTLIVIALPRFAIADELQRIAPFLRAGQTLVFIPGPAGMEDIVAQMRMQGVSVIAFQRTPVVSRIAEYGHAVRIGAPRRVNKLALSDTDRYAEWETYFKWCFGGEVSKLSSFLSLTLSNSNPLLHPARIVPLLNGGVNGCYPQCPYFYAEWTDESSRLYLAADDEMSQIFQAVSPETFQHDYESALVHYEATNMTELTAKIRSIPSLHEIVAPWKLGSDGLWHPDYTSRYFTEDVPFGTKIIQQYARKVGISTPTIDHLIARIDQTRPS